MISIRSHCLIKHLYTTGERLWKKSHFFVIAPSRPRNIRVLGVSDTTIQISWWEPARANGVLQGYRIYMLHQNFTSVQTVRSNKSSVIETLTRLSKYFQFFSPTLSELQWSFYMREHRDSKLLLQIRVFELRFIGYPSVKDNWLMVRKNRKITRHLTVVALAMTYPAAAESACHQSPRIHSCSLLSPKKWPWWKKSINMQWSCRSLFGALLFGSAAAFRVTDKKFRLILNWPLTHDIDTIELCFCTTLSFLNPILHFMGQK